MNRSSLFIIGRAGSIFFGLLIAIIVLPIFIVLLIQYNGALTNYGTLSLAKCAGPISGISAFAVIYLLCRLNIKIRPWLIILLSSFFSTLIYGYFKFFFNSAESSKIFLIIALMSTSSGPGILFLIMMLWPKRPTATDADQA